MPLKAGRELDRYVAEEVLGLGIVEDPRDVSMLVREHLYPVVGYSLLKPYSTDISAALEVVAKLGRCWDFTQGTDGSYTARLTDTYRFGDEQIIGHANTLEEVICIAALSALSFIEMIGMKHEMD